MQLNNLVFQSGMFNFFFDIQDKSAAPLMHANAKHCVLDTYHTPKTFQPLVTKLNASRITLKVPVDLPYSVTYNDIYTQFQNIMRNRQFDVVTLINGVPDFRLKMQEQHYETYLLFKSNSNVPIKSYSTWKQAQRGFFILHMLMEWCATNNVPVINIIEDPLQAKLHYIKGLRIKHYYFHKMPGDGYYRHTDKPEFAFKYNFSPSQQYSYMFNDGAQLDDTSYNKLLNFVFALTDSWRAKHIYNQPDLKGKSANHHTTRSDIITQLLHLIDNPKHIQQHGIMFKFKSANPILSKKYDNKLVPYKEYMSLIAKSKFTLVLPSYDEKYFSLRRFFEALSVGCVPFILETCNYKDGVNRSTQLIEIIEKHLLIRYNELSDIHSIILSKSQIHDKILHDIKQTKFWQTYTNKAFYVSSIQSMYNNANLRSIKANDYVIDTYTK
jgi:hypothetical protein